ncbi:MAG: glycosyltransferase [Ignavibacteriaceae bacterium]|nr:glycosyltransferase [Ignavibacteriaceae bacterium]
MKVVHLSNSDLSGGAAIACKRIVEAQVKNGIDSALLVQRKLSSDPKVYSTTTNLFSTLRYNVRFILDEGYIRLLTNQSRGRFSNPLIGANLADHPIVKSSDIINLHWINGGFLSLDTLKKLGKLGKPIVWTLHDMWAFTGGCHYSLDCRKFESSCGNCPSLKFSGEKDASNKIFSHKIFFSELNLTIVTCSKWLKQETEKSLILGQKRVENIPNPIDTEIYQKYDTSTTRRKLGLADEKFYILFGAMNTKDERKGFKFLIESLKSLTQ